MEEVEKKRRNFAMERSVQLGGKKEPFASETRGGEIQSFWVIGEDLIGRTNSGNSKTKSPFCSLRTICEPARWARRSDIMSWHHVLARPIHWGRGFSIASKRSVMKLNGWIEVSSCRSHSPDVLHTARCSSHLQKTLVFSPLPIGIYQLAYRIRIHLPYVSITRERTSTLQCATCVKGKLRTLSRPPSPDTCSWSTWEIGSLDQYVTSAPLCSTGCRALC